MVRTRKIVMTLMLLIAFMVSGLQANVQAAGKQGTISIIGPEEKYSLAEKTVPYSDKESAYDVLVKAVGENNIKTMEYPGMGKFINGIYGLEGTEDYSHYWSLFINGISAQTGADAYFVQDGDKLTFQYVGDGPQKSVSIKIVGKDGKDLIPANDFVGFIGEPSAMQLLQVVMGKDRVNYRSFSVNGTVSTVSAENYHLQAGDKISFQYDTIIESTPVPAVNVENQIHKAIQFYQKKSLGEWEVIALKQAGAKNQIPASYLEDVKKIVKEKQGKLKPITEAERYVLGIVAAGGDPTNIEGYNLVESIYNGDVTKQGLNGVAYALIALDSANFPVPDTALWSRVKLVKQLLDKQNSDGGWTWNPQSTTSDPDTTAMVLIALAPYQSESGVKEKVATALQYVTQQFKDGKIDNSSTAAQVVIALSALGIDANSTAFTNAQGSLLQFLLTFQNADGGFDWQGGDKSDVYSTAQGFQALVAYQLFSKGKGPLYSLPLMPQKETNVPGKVEKPDVATPGQPLPDTAGNSMNLFILGLFLLMMGSMIFVWQHRRKA